MPAPTLALFTSQAEVQPALPRLVRHRPASRDRGLARFPALPFFAPRPKPRAFLSCPKSVPARFGDFNCVRSVKVGQGQSNPGNAGQG